MNGAFEWREAPEAEFAVIGDPVGHSLSPRMHSAAFRAAGLAHRYVAVRVPAEDVWRALDRLASLGYLGANVTVPNKGGALRWSSNPDGLAAAVGAANTVRFADRACTNTDVPGFLETLDSAGFRPSRALVLGAGGSAAAVAFALHWRGVRFDLWNRTEAKARALVSDLGFEVPVHSRVPSLADYNLIVNATTASIRGQELPLGSERLAPGTLAYDLGYGPEPTRFQVQMAGLGADTVDGRPLLVAQGALSLRFWLGLEADRSAMLGAIR